MDFFHLEVKMISRGSGRSVVAAAAYASCTKLYNDYDGITHDYTRKKGCVYSEIFLPDIAPVEWKERQALWEAVETAEKTKDSRLAREIILALPVELSLNDWKNMLNDFVINECVNLGMCADVNIHNNDLHNPHAHILLTVRPLDNNGKWQAKTQKEYLCKLGDKEKGFTADEFKIAKTEGWEKQYQYLLNNKKVYLTPSQAEKLKDCERISKTPKSTRYGRQNKVSSVWNSDEQVFRWRKSWEVIVNKAQEKQGIEDRVDCRSYLDRGLEQKPTIHEGYHARKLEKMGVISDKCELNRQIRYDNKLINQLKKHTQKLIDAIKENIPNIAEVLETLKNNMIILQYKILSNSSKKNYAEYKYQITNINLDEYKTVQKIIKDKEIKLSLLIKDKEKCNVFQFIKKNKLSEQITTLIEEIEEFRSYKSRILSKLGCNENEVKNITKKLYDIKSTAKTFESQNQILNSQKEEYKSEFNKIKEENTQPVDKERDSIRDKIREKMFNGLDNKDLLSQSIDIIDYELGEKVQKEKSVLKQIQMLKNRDKPKKHKNDWER